MIDTRELDQWADALRAAGDDALKQSERMVSKGSLNVKNDARELAPHGPHTPSYRSSISYDITTGEDRVEGEIGPDKNRRQGALGNLFEYGTVDTPAIPHLNPALDAEEPRFYEAAKQLAAELVERHSR